MPEAPNVVADAARRAREEVVAAILGAARSQLGEVGAAALSLRRIARELGMASSGIYRYVESRDALLTMLIIQAYDELADAAVAARDDTDPARQQWVDIAVAVRRWGVAHPHEWALLYGSPVPGYVAPEDTIGPGTRVMLLLLDVVTTVAGDLRPADGPAPDGALDHDLARMLEPFDVDLPGAVVARLLTGWSQLFGMVSLELFGQLKGADVDGEALLRHAATAMAAHIGLPT